MKESELYGPRKHIIKLLRMLGLGLITIDAGKKNCRAYVLLDPGEYKPRRSKLRRERYAARTMSNRCRSARAAQIG